MSDELPISFSHSSDVGRVREHNEDCVAVETPADPEKRRQGRLFVVADGMGGYLAGEVASRLAVETVLVEYYADSPADTAARLQNAVQAANDAVYASAHGDRSRAGMGTTIVATAIAGHKAYVASVGDSRAYVVHEGELAQITHDHSLVGEQIRAGLITKEQARMHPQRNVITRALGSQPVVTVDMFEGELVDGDILVMCTDGLTGHVPDDRLCGAVVQLPPDQAVKRLIELANQDGGTDNISVIVIRVGQPVPVVKAATPASTATSVTTDALTAASAVTLRSDTVPAKPAPKGLSHTWIMAGAVIAFVAVVTVGVLALGLGGIWLFRKEHTSTPTFVPTAQAATSVVPTPMMATLESAPVETTLPPSAPPATMTSAPISTLTPTPAPPTPDPDKPGTSVGQQLTLYQSVWNRDHSATYRDDQSYFDIYANLDGIQFAPGP